MKCAMRKSSTQQPTSERCRIKGMRSPGKDPVNSTRPKVILAAKENEEQFQFSTAFK